MKQVKYIKIQGAKQNNLKSLNLKIPLGTFTVVCGPSGSGKSSLAFQTLFAEGQRHYTQTLSNYARQYIQELPKPLVKSIHNIPPALALEQKNSVRSSRPTVATLTELADFLRLLFTHTGQMLCPEHQIPLLPRSPIEGAKLLQKIFPNGKGIISVPVCPSATGLSFAHLKKKLLKEGFYRIVRKQTKTRLPKIEDLRSSQKPLPSKKFYIVIDRLTFKDRDRLTDSLKTAYKVFLRYNKQAVKGEALVTCLSDKPTDKPPGRLKRKTKSNHKNLILSEKPVCLYCAYLFPFFPLQTSFFNFNSSLGACLACKGFGSHLILDEKKVIPQPKKSLIQGAVSPFTMPSATFEFRSLKLFCKRQHIDLHCPWEKLPSDQRKKIWEGYSHFMGIKGFFDYLESKKYKMYVRVFLSRYKSETPCSGCGGSRLRKEVSYVVFRGKTITEMLSMNVDALRKFFQKVFLSKEESKKVGEIVRKIQFILDGLSHIGLNYLELNRPVKTLSSGEFQRLNLVHQLGLGLSQVLYVLDEPTVGLHPKDSLRLIDMLKKVQQKGNTLIVVEHDPDMIKQADFVVEMGPGSGLRGGEVMFAGEKKAFFNNKSSLTRSFLLSPKKERGLAQSVDPEKYKYFLEISGCKGRNLKNVCFRTPLNRLVAVTGVSGSGKSTLISETLYPALARSLGLEVLAGEAYEKLKGNQYLKRVVWLDSAPVEKTKRSLPVTYLKIYNHIREIIADYHNKNRFLEVKPGLFSLNVDGGRCPECSGLGYQEIEMVFMDPVRILCEECKGKRFKPEILSLKWRNKNIHQILNMTVASASEFFVSFPAIWKPLSLLKKVGLDYLILGQTLASLSGGEVQRLKLARELLNGQLKNTLYILDEPTVGLHFQEVELLFKLLKDLVSQGSSVLLIEHNLDLIRQADYIIDIGPGAGPKGGKILVQGPPEEVARSSLGFTSGFLKKVL